MPVGVICVVAVLLAGKAARPRRPSREIGDGNGLVDVVWIAIFTGIS